MQCGHIRGAINIVSLEGVNGGWTAWDGAMTLPIVEGDQPYDADYAL